MAHFVFRTAEIAENPYLLAEMNAGRLRQGWGAPPMALERDGEKVPEGAWWANYTTAIEKYWKGSSIDEDRNRYGILSRMLDFSPGDIVVVPKTPRWETFTIAEIVERYQFDDSPERYRRGLFDFRHVIRIGGLKIFADASQEGQTVNLVGLGSAVNNIRNQSLIAAIDKLYHQR